MPANRSKPAPVRPTAAKSVPHTVRIIGGQWKRTPLAVVNGPGLRPTPDRVRETVFNWLGHQFGSVFDGLNVLDLFAGTGAMGFEAASRGVAQALLVDSHSAAVRALHAAKEKLHADNIAIRQGDALANAQSLARQAAQFDVIFLDPPFAEGWLARILPLAAPLLSARGRLYVECEALLEELIAPELLDSFEVVRADKAGQVFYYLLRCKQ